MATQKSKPKPATENLPAIPEGEDWQKLLLDAGLVNPAMGGSTINRLSVKGTTIYAGKDAIAEYSQIKREPALYVQLVGAPRQYQALYFDKAENAGKDGSNAGLANFVGRPEIAGKFCKSHFDVEDEARRFAEDGTSCDLCPVHPFVPKDQLPPEAKGKKCSWRADVDFRILEKREDGTLAPEDDTIWTMSLSTTSVIEFFGAGGKKNENKLAGSVSEMHTMARIGAIGFKKWGREGVLKAKTMLDLGGVVAEIHILPQENKAQGRAWNVISFNPIEILEREEPEALESSDDTPADGTLENENVPF